MEEPQGAGLGGWQGSWGRECLLRMCYLCFMSAVFWGTGVPVQSYPFKNCPLSTIPLEGTCAP